MQYLEAVMILFGGIGALLIGMGILSDNMKRLANARLEKSLNKISNSKIKGFGVGLVTTAVVQSSSITTVMVVGLVNAGVISLLQATTIIMGANVGTTITAHIAALQSFNFVIFAMALAFIGSFMNIISIKDKTKTIGKVLQGLGLIFISLHLLSGAMGIFKEFEAIENILYNIKSPVTLLLIGIILTAIFQSSSAITSIVISSAIAGIVIGGGGNSPLYIILGSNIGTTLVAIYASLGANVNAKRASVIHILFNLVGSFLFMLFLLLWPGFNDTVLRTLFPKEATQIAMFHTFFNVFCAMLFLPFSNLFVKVSEKIIKDNPNEMMATIVLEERLLQTPGLAIRQLKREIEVIANNAMNCLKSSFNSFTLRETVNDDQIYTCIKHGSKLNKQTIEYLIKLSSEKLSSYEKQIISKLYHVINDVERVGDLASNLVKYTNSTIVDDLSFSDSAIDDLKDMFRTIEELFKEAMKVFITGNKNTYIIVEKLEQAVDDKRKMIVDNHIKRLNEEKCSPEASPILINLVSNLERAADHIHFMAKEMII